MKVQSYKIEIYIPEEHIDALRSALNEAGACRLGNYDNCMSVVQVTGFWRPLEGADPYDGKVGEVNTGTEVKAEVICDAEHLEKAVATARKVHPYEEPMINIIPLHTL